MKLPGSAESVTCAERAADWCAAVKSASAQAAADRRSTGAGRWLCRKVLFPLLAVLLGLSPFVAAEITFRALGWGRPDWGEDPFVGFSEVRPLFVLSEDGRQYVTDRTRLGYFRPEAFAAVKPADEFRIFVLGGSTVQGRPFSIETSFTTWLELALCAAQPERRWEVVNCGGVSYASYRLVPILKEVLAYDPDLIVLYTGHNEFLEERSYGHIKHLPPAVRWLFEQVAQTRTYVLARRVYMQWSGRGKSAMLDDRPILSAETDAVLEYEGGLAQYHRDDRQRQIVVEHYRYNLRRMIHLARQAGVPVLLVNPVSNLRDCPPFKNQHREGLSGEQLARWRELFEEAGRHLENDIGRSIELLEEARRIDDRHAGLHYALGQCYEIAGMIQQAKVAYIRAKEEDVCPLRMIEPLHQALWSVARRTGTPVVDVRRLVERESEHGIPGGYLLLDHVHPSIACHQMIAEALLAEMVRQGWVHPEPGWNERRVQSYKEHLESLDDFYFVKGLERLEVLRCWTQGKAKGRKKRWANGAGGPR